MRLQIKAMLFVLMSVLALASPMVAAGPARVAFGTC